MGTDLLQQYNILNNTVNTYNYNNGLPKAELKDFFAFNNEIFIATSEGLILCTYKTKNLNTKAPLLTINNVIVNNQSFSIT